MLTVLIEEALDGLELAEAKAEDGLLLRAVGVNGVDVVMGSFGSTDMVEGSLSITRSAGR